MIILIGCIKRNVDMKKPSLRGRETFGRGDPVFWIATLRKKHYARNDDFASTYLMQSPNNNTKGRT